MLTVSDIMTRDPATVDLDMSLRDAIIQMKRRSCRQLPVLSGERVVGIITDRDIRLAMNSPFVLHDRSDDESILMNTKIADCMTASPLTIEAGAPASSAADMLRTYKFGGLPVVEDGRLVGIVTVTDILQSFINLVSEFSKQ